MQFVTHRREDHRPFGLLQFYQFNAESGFGYLSFILDPEFIGQGWPIEALVLFINHLFVSRNLRKLYMETADSSLANYGRYRPRVGLRIRG